MTKQPTVLTLLHHPKSTLTTRKSDQQEQQMVGRPSAVLVDQICVWLGLIWDDAEELKRLAALSHPKPTINARGHSAEAIYMVNLLAQNIDRLSATDCSAVTDAIVTRLQQVGDKEASNS